MDYETQSHGKYLIALHLILVVKYRKQLLLGRIGELIKRQVSDISNYSVAQHVSRIKQTTNRRLWRTFPYLKNEFWREKTFWSDGYFVCSVGNASEETIRKYIQEQG